MPCVASGAHRAARSLDDERAVAQILFHLYEGDKEMLGKMAKDDPGLLDDERAVARNRPRKRRRFRQGLATTRMPKFSA